MVSGKYPPSPIIVLCGLFLFFLGFIAFQTANSAFVSLFAIVLLTVCLSFRTRTPLGGLLLGLFASTAFLLGYLFMGCVTEVSQYGPDHSPEEHLKFLTQLVGSDEFAYVKWSLLSAVSAISSIGLFFGMLGYIFEHISLEVTVTQPGVFRDYWSNVHLLGKSDRQEYHALDRKLSSWSIGKKEWWKRIVEKMKEPTPDLVFSQRPSEDAAERHKGNLFDLTTGRMIGKDLIDPMDLVAKYRPSVLKVAEIGPAPEGIRRLALESLVARFLHWFNRSRPIWLFYMSLSIFFVSLVYVVWRSGLAAYPYFEGDKWYVLMPALVASGVLLGLVWRWRKASQELLQRRPDERVLIFLVYAILALLYGFFLEVIVNPPFFYLYGSRPPGALGIIPAGWIGSWSIWTGCFIFFSIIIGLGYICIHRESEIVNIYFYDNRTPTSGVTTVPAFKESYDEPFWLKEENVDAFWVLRFMYFWRYELAKVPHPDWERVEVWIDAETGTVRWVVSDYHYRELWYRVIGDLPVLYVNFFINFHTPVPVVNAANAESISRVFQQETIPLIKTAIVGKAPGIMDHIGLETLPQRWTDIHAADWIRPYGLLGVTAAFCSKLAWTYWRYPYGLEKGERYRKEPASRVEDQPAAPNAASPFPRTEEKEINRS